MAVNINKGKQSPYPHRRTYQTPFGLESLEKLVKRLPIESNEVIELLASHDTLTKKLTCDYLVDRSVKNSELSLLTANLLLRDTSDANPAIRSTSLLALSTLPEMEEAAISSVIKSLSDPSAQVRRASAICCINIHRHSPSVFLESALVNLLYECIRDSDPIVVTNCLIALENVLLLEGSLVVNKNIASFLTQNLSLFSDCNLVYVLNILRKYSPKSEEEIFKILNDLDCCFTSPVPSVLAASCQLFLHLIKCYPHLSSDLFAAVKDPVIKILSKNIPEVSYLLIDQLQSLKFEMNLHLGDCYKMFLLKTKDPAYLKTKKLAILPLVANDITTVDIISEVQHYTSDFQSYKAAFECLGSLGSFNSESMLLILDILTAVLKNPRDDVVIVALECFLTILRSDRYAKVKAKEIIADSSHKALIHNISHSLSSPNLQKNNPILVMQTFKSIVPIMESDKVHDVIKELFNQMVNWDIKTKCFFIRVASVVFLHHPTISQPIFTLILSTSFNSPEKQLKNEAAFMYAILEEGPAETMKLLSNLFDDFSNS